MIVILVIGIAASYAMAVAIIFHSTIASLLAGALFGPLMGGMIRHWRPARKGISWLPHFALLAVVLLAWRELGSQFVDFCRVLCIAFLFAYLRLHRLEEASRRMVRRQQQLMWQQDIERKILEGHLLSYLQFLEPGQTTCIGFPLRDFRLLTRRFMWMETQGWSFVLIEPVPRDSISLLFTLLEIKAPASEEALQDSLDALCAEPETDEE